MPESFITTPDDSALTGKRLRIWSGSTGNSGAAEAMVITLADADNTYVDPRDINTSSATFIRWGSTSAPEWIEGSGSTTVNLTTVPVQIWAHTVTAGRTGSIYGIILVGPSLALNYSLYSGSTMKTMIFQASTYQHNYMFASTKNIYDFSGSTVISIRVARSAQSSVNYVHASVLYGEG